MQNEVFSVESKLPCIFPEKFTWATFILASRDIRRDH